MTIAINLYRSKLTRASTLSFQITGSALTVNEGSVYFPYPTTENWQKAIGGHNLWVSADIHVEKSPSGIIHFIMELTLHVEDMYNFNPGVQNIATGIPDSESGIFSIIGLAKQYVNYLTLTRGVEWKGFHVRLSKVSKEPFLRSQKPRDNRLLRNNL